MVEQFSILGICGSLRRGSYNLMLLHAAQQVAPADVEINIYLPHDIPLYNEDVEGQGDPESVQFLKEAIRVADALLIATPEYNYSIPGVLKNAIDWASRPPDSSPLHHKPIALMGASPGNFGTVRAQLALRQSFVFTRSYVLLEPEVLVFRAQERFDQNGHLTDETTRGLIHQLLVRLVDLTRQLRGAAVLEEVGR